jgi:hypothetical protein
MSSSARVSSEGEMVPGSVPDRKYFTATVLSCPWPLGCWRYFKPGLGRGGKMKNQIVAALKKTQIVVAFIAGGAIIIAPAIFVVALVRLSYVRGIGAALARPISEKVDAWRRGEAVIVRRGVDAVESNRNVR